MFDGADKPAEPDWKAIATLVMQQRDRAEAKANNLEIDLALAQQRETALPAIPPAEELAAAHARIVELETACAELERHSVPGIVRWANGELKSIPALSGKWEPVDKPEAG